jgi:hypothetical protein
VVEPALAKALVLAAEAHRWELVAQIAAELAARRRCTEVLAPGSRSPRRPVSGRSSAKKVIEG